VVTARSGGCVIAVAPEVAAEGGALAGFGIALLSLLMFVVLRGIKGVWQITFGALLLGIAAAVRIDVWRVHLNPGAKLVALDHTIVDAITEAALGYEHAMGFWFHQSAHLQGWIADETWKIARDTLHLGTWLVHVYVPSAIHDATSILARTTHAVTHTVTRVERVVIHTPAIAKAAAHAAVAPLYRTVAIPHLGELQWLHRHWKAITAAAAAAGSAALAPALALPRLWRGIDDVQSDLRKAMKRVRRVEALLGATAMAAAMANVLGIPNPKCLRRGPLGRIARLLCGVDSWIIDLLVLGSVEAFVASDLCGFTDLLIAEATSLRPALMELVSVEDALINCHGASSPARLALPPVSLPARVDSLTLAA
jgi:hypothetical protein